MTSKRAASSTRPARVRLLTAVVSTFCCLVALEIGLRIHFGVTSTGVLEDAFETPAIPPPGKIVKLGEIIRAAPDPRIIYQLKPGLDVVFEDAILRTNEGGWREEEIPVEKPPGTLRIVGIGDSHMFGWGVDVRERYMDLIEARLNESHPERQWQSLVFAAPGYNAQMEVAALERYGMQYQPDLIVYGMVLNDHCLPNFVLAGHSPWALRSFTLDYARRAFVEKEPRRAGAAGLLMGSYNDYRLHEICEPERAPPRYRGSVGRAVMLASLAELAELGERRDIPVIVLVTLRDSDPRTGLARKIARLRQQLPWLRPFFFADEVTKWLAAEGHEGYLGSPLARSAADPHPSATGHALKARLFVEELERTGLTRTLIGMHR